MAAVAGGILCVASLSTPALANDPLDAEPQSLDVAEPLSSRQRADDIDQSAGYAVGRIRIPEIGLDATVRAGVAIAVIDQGPAHWVGTASAGNAGNVVIAGHRTTHSAPFRNLDQLDAGHLVYVTSPAGFDVMYRVFETLIVSPEDVWISYETPEPMLTMFACHPVGSAAQRIVVRAELVAGRLIA